MLLGSGGREHALAWKLAQSPLCDTLFAAPGNPGIAEEAELVDLNIADHSAVISFCAGHDIGLVVVGPEAPLVDGLGDALREAGVPVFGPNQKAAQLEGSKGFTKDMCAAAGIPTAGYRRYDSMASALAGLAEFEPPYVIKADGLAAGKGVIIAETLTDAKAAIEDMFGGGFGDAGTSVVIEEFMTGEEASFFALTDGKDVVAFGSAQDHKRVGEGDTGPNTGGMGAYAPLPWLPSGTVEEIHRTVLQPVVDQMARQGAPFSGLLYCGLAMTSHGPSVIEFNCRFGDPETQVVLPLLESDLLPILLTAARGDLGDSRLEWRAQKAVCVVLASGGYPGSYQTGLPIRGVSDAAHIPGALVFHAGTTGNVGQWRTAGGRVLNIVGRGDSFREAAATAYRAADAIEFEGSHRRRDA